MKNYIVFFILIVILIFGFYFFKVQKTNAPTQALITPANTVRQVSTKEQIVKALSQKHNWNPLDIDVHIATVEGDFAKGDVRFKDEMGGGLWFAANVNGAWKIVYDGNGIITCDQLTSYQDFPKDLIPHCYDKQTEKLLTR